MKVRRRYNEFTWLDKQLRTRHPTIEIPPLPPKQALGRFKDEFVEGRRRELHAYMHFITNEPVLREDSVVQLFCECAAEVCRFGFIRLMSGTAPWK